MNELQNRRRALMAAKEGSGLPSAYQQVEWIESNSYSALDTGVSVDLSTVVRCGIQEFAVGTDNPNVGYPEFFGVSTNNNSSVFYLQTSKNYGRNHYVKFGNSGDKTIAMDALNSFVDVLIDENHAVLGERSATYSAGTFFYDPTLTLSIFSRRYSDGTCRKGIKMRCSYFKIEKGGELVCDLVPCYRKSDGVIGMYDLVQRVFRTNISTYDGTGVFTKGADV